MESSEVIDTSPKTFVILGCKRSGTSFMAEVIGEHGVKIETCGNGHNEDIDFVRLNDTILKEAGGDWNNLPSDYWIEKAVENHKEELKELIKSRASKANMWGWKDPRQGATIKHFLPHLKDDVYLVCVFRNPRKVVDSMYRIWLRDPKETLEIYKAYNDRIIEAIKEFTDVRETAKEYGS